MILYHFFYFALLHVCIIIFQICLPLFYKQIIVFTVKSFIFVSEYFCNDTDMPNTTDVTTASNNPRYSIVIFRGTPQ